MTKDRRVNSPSSNRAMASPYSRESLKAASDNPFSHVGDEKEWDDIQCPICMEHPHNAVLLLCSSHDKGCRPFICDTSYRHSNCLDQFHKSFSKTPSDLLCPLCRGTVTGSNVIPSARKYMDLKTRSCSLETCSFSGNYAELRRHARIDHPCKRPSEASPTRQSNWAEMERQRDIEDALAYDWELEDDFFSGDGFLDFESRMSDIENSLMDHIFELNWHAFTIYDDDLSFAEEMIDSLTMDGPTNDSSTSDSPLRIGGSRSIHRRLINSPRRQENENASTSLRPRSSYYHRVEANTRSRSRSRSSYYHRREHNTRSRPRSGYHRRDAASEMHGQPRGRYEISSSESSRRRPRPPSPPPRYRSPSPGRDFPETFRRER